MKKEEMATADSAYASHAGMAAKLERAGRLREATAAAKAAWLHVDGMLQFGRRYGGRDAGPVAAIDVVLRCAPPLFDRGSLADVRVLLDACKRIGRDAKDYTADLEAASLRLHSHHRLWAWLDAHGEVPERALPTRLGQTTEHWRPIVEVWVRSGVIRRHSMTGAIGLVTRMDQVIEGKCPHCGGRVRGSKRSLLESIACPGCGKQAGVVLLPGLND